MYFSDNLRVMFLAIGKHQDAEQNVHQHHSLLRCDGPHLSLQVFQPSNAQTSLFSNND